MLGTKARSIAASSVLVLAMSLGNSAGAQVTDEPYGAQPPPGSMRSNVDFDYQVKYQRAFEALLWSMPAVQTINGRRAHEQALNGKDNDIVAMSDVATPKLETVTANGSTPYIWAYTDLKKEPVVLEIPAAGADGSLYGQVVDAWQMTIADVGPSGLDAGKGGKYLFTGPDFEGEVPEGHIHVKSPNYRIMFAFRSVRAPGKTAEDAYAYSKRLRMYYLSEAENPPEQKFIDPIDDRFPAMVPFDERHFELVHALVDYEPIRTQDKHIVGLLASLGIEKGKPFDPDPVARRAMRQAAIDAWHYLQERLDNLPRDYYFWPDRQYVPLLLPDENGTFTYEYADRIDVDGRALAFFWCTTMPAQVSDRPATYYLMAMADDQGRELEAGRTYKVTVPADVPITQFWALTMYDRATMTFIYTKEMRTTLDSYGLDQMTKNADGSVTLYIGPTAPGGLESNWIPTGGKQPLPAFRFYGPEEPFYDKTFKLPDFERVD